MPEMDQPTSPAPKTVPEPRKPKAAATEPKPPPGLYALTVDTANARIVSVEKVDGSGDRQPLTAEEKTQLAKAHGPMPLRQLVERAFEAGIDALLGDESGADKPESKEDGEFSSMLLQTLIEGSKARELVKGDTLDRAMIGALIAHAAKSSTSSPGR